MISRSFLIGFAVLAGVPALALLLVVAFVTGPHSSFHSARIGGAFAMTEMTGRSVSEKDLAGKPFAIFFGYTSCPDICPTTLVALGDALRRMGPDADRLSAVFVTLDPQRDTPEQMRAYLASFDPRIRGFTGTQAQTDAMADGFHISRRRVPLPGGSYTLDHAAGVFLFYARGESAGESPYDEPADGALAKLETLVSPKACLPEAPPRVDLWSGAALGSSCGAG